MKVTRRKIQLIKRNFDPTSDQYLEDEIVIDIMNGDVNSEGICMLSEFSGLYHAQRTSIRESAAYEEGSTPSNFPRTDERAVDIRLATKAKTAERWEQIETILWSIIRMDRDCILRVWTEDEYRELKVRLSRTPKDTMRYDPEYYCHMIWAIQFVASDPWWYGELITSEWKNSNASGSGKVYVANPADQPCFIEWASGQVYGTEIWSLPDAINVKAPSPVKMITMPPVQPRDEFLVETHPLKMPMESRSNKQLTAFLRAKRFEFFLPPHTEYVELPVTLTGGSTLSTIKAYCQTRWERPYGGESWTSIPAI